MIPHTLHFIWYEREIPFSEYQLEAIQLALKNTTYDIFLHTNVPHKIPSLPRLTVKEYTFIEKNNIRACSICDIARLDIVGKYGGIYSDIDFFWLKEWDLDKNLNLVAVYENPSYKIVCNSVFACSPNTDFSVPIDLIKLEIEKIGDKDITVFSVKNHLFGMKITGNYFKLKADCIENKRSKFFRNTWRKMERGEPLNTDTTAIHLSATLGHTQKYFHTIKMLV